MKKTVSAIGLLVLMAACKHKPPHPPTGNYPCIIPVDTANMMIGSYVTSINYPANDTDVVSFTVDADALRFLLDSMPNSPLIHHIQLKLAHTQEYINSGHAGEPAGYSSKALTLLMSGVSHDGDCVLVGDQVINHARPCPKTCPNGSAANPFYTVTKPKPR